MKVSVEGKTAIVTGSATGVGLAVADCFLRQGANVVLADIDEEKLTSAFEPGDTEKKHIRTFCGDLCEKLAVSNLLSTTIDAFGRVDILVNATRLVKETNLLDCDDDSVQAVMETNVFSNLRLTRAVALQMIAQHDAEKGAQEDGSDIPSAGAIVNLTSIFGAVQHPDLLGYSMASATIEKMTRAMALFYAPHHIRVNAVAFGSVMSRNMHVRLRHDSEQRGRIEEATPLGRIAKASEVAQGVQFLASDAAGFITGQVLTIDGGRTLLDPARSAII